MKTLFQIKKNENKYLKRKPLIFKIRIINHDSYLFFLIYINYINHL